MRIPAILILMVAAACAPRYGVRQTPLVLLIFTTDEEKIEYSLVEVKRYKQIKKKGIDINIAPDLLDWSETSEVSQAVRSGVYYLYLRCVDGVRSSKYYVSKKLDGESIMLSCSLQT
ncbi:MAG: hypothetical protein AAFX54_12755 [Pseudomonadota bacterium]